MIKIKHTNPILWNQWFEKYMSKYKDFACITPRSGHKPGYYLIFDADCIQQKQSVENYIVINDEDVEGNPFYDLTYYVKGTILYANTIHELSMRHQGRIPTIFYDKGENRWEIDLYAKPSDKDKEE